MINILSKILCFVVFSSATWLLSSDLFLPGLDEGIYLNGARRLLMGQTPYRDFFAFTGPLVYLLQGLMEWMSPANLSTARLTVAGSVGLMATGAVAVAQGANASGWRVPLLAGFLWWGFSFSMYVRFLVNHRWISSGAFSLAAILLFGLGIRSVALCAGAGFAMGIAVCATPSFIAPSLIVLCFLLWESRRLGLAFLAGLTIPGLAAIGWFIANDALYPFLNSLAWISTSYTKANLVPFAFGLFENVKIMFAQGKVNRNFLGAVMGPLVIVFCIPVAAWLWWYRKEKQLAFPLLFCIGGLITSYPRMEFVQLVFVSAPFFGLAISLLFRSLKDALHPLAQALLVFPASYFLLAIFTLRSNYEPVSTRAGLQLGLPGTARAMEKLQNLIPAGETVFVFPYLSSLYYLLQVNNPTRYDYLQPGMMSFDDESRALEDLERHPPQFVVWQTFPESEILKAWPGSDPGRMRFERIERFIRSYYRPVDEAASPHFRLDIWKRN